MGEPSATITRSYPRVVATAVFGLGFGFAFSRALDTDFDVVFWLGVALVTVGFATMWHQRTRANSGP